MNDWYLREHGIGFLRQEGMHFTKRSGIWVGMTGTISTKVEMSINFHWCIQWWSGNAGDL